MVLEYYPKHLEKLRASKKPVDLSTGLHNPYQKPNNQLTYVHAKSNHPPSILQNIPSAINKRLSSISSNQNIFNDFTETYQQALNESEYNYKLNYQPTNNNLTNNKRKRSREIIWFNPPYSQSVKTDVARQFLRIIKTEFPKEHQLNKIFNVNKIKVSYSCMPNVKQKIDGHNQAILNRHQTTDNTTHGCNCRNRNDCPLNGHCLKTALIYQATVSTENNSDQTYIGLTEGTFKSRFNNHKASFNHFHKKTDTKLSEYVWDLKQANRQYTIKWNILRHARPYSPKSKRCNLCLLEKYYIIIHPELGTLNKRNELVSSCRHAAKFLLRNAVT